MADKTIEHKPVHLFFNRVTGVYVPTYGSRAKDPDVVQLHTAVEVDELRRHLAMALRWIEVEMAAAEDKHNAEAEAWILNCTISSTGRGQYLNDTSHVNLQRIRELVKGVPLPKAIEERREKMLERAAKEGLI